MTTNTEINVTHIPPAQPLRIIIGAGEQSYTGWIATQQEQLDLLSSENWDANFGTRPVDAFLCEHVWEHLTEDEGRQAAALCYRYLKPGSYLRCAVPDGFFPDPEYQQMVQIGGPGPQDHPAADHRIVYNYRSFSRVFTDAGFQIDLLEYCDEAGRFHYNHWDAADGLIYRSLRFDHRNQDSQLRSVSIIVDAHKPTTDPII